MIVVEAIFAKGTFYNTSLTLATSCGKGQTLTVVVRRGILESPFRLRFGLFCSIMIGAVAWVVALVPKDTNRYLLPPRPQGQFLLRVTGTKGNFSTWREIWVNEEPLSFLILSTTALA